MPMPAGARGCIFDTAELGSCENEPYGYIVPKAPLGAQSGYNPGLPHSDLDYVQYLPWKSPGFVKPCLFLKLNKIFGWEPTPVTCTDESCANLQVVKVKIRGKKLITRLFCNHQKYKYYTFVFYNSNQDEKYKKMTGGLKNTIARNFQANDTDYVYIDCFGRWSRTKSQKEVIIMINSRSRIGIRQNCGCLTELTKTCAGMLRIKRRWIWASNISQKTRVRLDRRTSDWTTETRCVQLSCRSANVVLPVHRWKLPRSSCCYPGHSHWMF